MRQGWTRDVLQAVGIDFVSGVPDSVLKSFITDLEMSFRAAYHLANREDGAIALATGAYLAGHRPLVFMKSAGLGTSLDSIMSLAIAYGIPLTLLIGWSGHQARDEPYHNIVGQALPDLLRALGIRWKAVPVADLEAWTGALGEVVEESHRAKRPAALLAIPGRGG